MNNNAINDFKLSYLKSAFISCGLTNCIFNALCYYFMHRSAEPMDAAGFVINACVTAFILSLISAAAGVPTVHGKYKKGKIPPLTYTRDTYLLMKFFPRGAKGQVFATAVVVTLIFIFVSSGLVILTGYAAKPIPVIPGTIIHGIQTGLMGTANMYFICVARVSTLEEKRLAEAA